MHWGYSRSNEVFLRTLLRRLLPAVVSNDAQTEHLCVQSESDGDSIGALATIDSGIGASGADDWCLHFAQPRLIDLDEARPARSPAAARAVEEEARRALDLHQLVTAALPNEFDEPLQSADQVLAELGLAPDATSPIVRPRLDPQSSILQPPPSAFSVACVASSAHLHLSLPLPLTQTTEF